MQCMFVVLMDSASQIEGDHAEVTKNPCTETPRSCYLTESKTIDSKAVRKRLMLPSAGDAHMHNIAAPTVW